MTYKSVVATRPGGPEVLEIQENELREPSTGEARIRVLAAGVGRTDVNYRNGYSPFSPRPPFVPGYQIVGTVDAVGAGVTRVKPGERVAALIGHGGYTEVVYLKQEDLAPVPTFLPPAEAVTIVLNYVSAYQMLHRVAKVKVGDRVLVTGASGGMGTALLDLGRQAGLKLVGTASPSKFATLTGFGAVPIDYHHPNYFNLLRVQAPEGFDEIFDGVGGRDGERGLELLRRGGKLVTYPAPTGFGSMILGALKIAATNLLPNGKSIEFYGITALYLRDRRPFMEDLPLLFTLLAEGKINPLITVRLPLLEAREANVLLESGQVIGNIVLLAPEAM